MNTNDTIGSRKADHIRINLEEDVSSGLSTGLERYRFIHDALPELDLKNIDLNQELLSKKISSPILISSMTGGTPDAERINHVLAIAAQEMGIAMGVGSQRVALEDPKTARTFQVRGDAPDILLFANIGAIQLNYGYGVSECQRAVDMIEADALILHFNPLQEAIQPEGDSNYSNLLLKIESVCNKLSVPVIAKEVGWGFSQNTAVQLANAGVKIIDVAGAGGTSWSQVEMHRATNPSQARIAATFIDWGIPTADAIINVRKASPDMIIFASGGIRNGLEIAKCIALGASLGGMASPFLKAANQSVEDTIQVINEIQAEIMITMFAAGAGNIDQLKRTSMVKT